MDRRTRFSQLFEHHHAAVRRYAHHRGLTGADADDLVADTFTVAWRRFDSVPTDDPLPWLFAVARNHWRNQLRRDRRRIELLDRLGPPQEVTDAAGAEGPSIAVIRSALASLTAADREILRLIAWDGLSPSQLAAALGCSAATARVRLHRARKRFARALEETERGSWTDTDTSQREEVRDAT